MEKLKNRKEKFEYTGKLAEYQLLSQDTVMQYEIDAYNSYQNYLYKRALYGLSGVTEKELESMCSKKKQRINKVYLKGQSVINVHKQKLTNTYSNILFKTFFPNNKITMYLINNDDIDINFKNTLTFKDLNISKDDIIHLFIQEGILPKNFINIKQDPNYLPRLKNQK
jgi:hypothetical protein